MAFKKEAIAFMEEGCTAYAAALHFGARENKIYDTSIFYQWKKKKNDIKPVVAPAKRVPGAGQKPKLEDIEDILADEIICLHLEKPKVTRSFIRQRALQLATDANTDFKASGH